MDFYEVVKQAAKLLQHQGKLTYRTLRRQFDLDDDALEDLKGELLPKFCSKIGGFYSRKFGIIDCHETDYAILVEPFHLLPTRLPRKIKAFKNPSTAAKGRKQLALPGDAWPATGL